MPVEARINAEEMMMELAVHLSAQKQLTKGQTHRMAGLDQLAFQHELAKRNV